MNEKKRCFTIELKKGSKPSDEVRVLLDRPFEGATPRDTRGPDYNRRFGLGYFAVMSLRDAANLCNAEGVAPITTYVDKILHHENS